MCKIVSYPNGTENVALSDNEVEVIILPTTAKRLEVVTATNLRKIISLSNKLTIGPANKRNWVPALNGCRNINEVVAFGDVEFNTTLRMNGKDTECAWTTGDEQLLPPVMTLVGDEKKAKFPCYYYGNGPIEETRLFDAEAPVRVLPAELIDTFLDSSFKEVTEVMPLDSKLARI